MKTIVRIAAISGALLAGGFAFGQETAPTMPAPAATPATTPTSSTPAAAPVSAVQPRVDDGWKSMPLGMMVKQVALTPEQTQKGKEINANYQKQYAALDASMPLEERKVKVKALMDAREVETQAMLTPVQLEKYKNMRAPNGQVATQPKPADPKEQSKPATVKPTAPVEDKK